MVRDNGKGFQLEPMPDGKADLAAEIAQHGLRRNGLINMRKRIQSIGGQIRLQSQPGQGTQLDLTVYLRNE